MFSYPDLPGFGDGPLRLEVAKGQLDSGSSLPLRSLPC